MSKLFKSNVSQSSDTENISRALMIWKFGRINTSASQKVSTEFQFQWISALCSLYSSFRQRNCDYFCISYESFWISFFRNDTGTHFAALSSSNSRIREELRKMNIKFSQPLKKSSEKVNDDLEVDSGFDLDNLQDPFAISEDLIDQDIREYERYTGTRVLEWQTYADTRSESVKESDDSVVILRGTRSIHQLIDFINNSELPEFSFAEATIYSHIPFMYSTCSPLSFKIRKVKKSGHIDFLTKKSESNLETEHMLEINGPLMILSLREIEKIFDKIHGNSYSLSLSKVYSIPTGIVKF